MVGTPSHHKSCHIRQTRSACGKERRTNGGVCRVNPANRAHLGELCEHALSQQHAVRQHWPRVRTSLAKRAPSSSKGLGVADLGVEPLPEPKLANARNAACSSSSDTGSHAACMGRSPQEVQRAGMCFKCYYIQVSSAGNSTMSTCILISHAAARFQCDSKLVNHLHKQDGLP